MQLRGLGGGVNGTVELPGGQRIHGIETGEQPPSGQDLALRMTHAPPGAQPLQQHRTEHGVAILAALALLHAQRHALAVHVGDLQADDLAGTQAGAVGHRQGHLVLDVACRRDQARDLVHAEHYRQRARHLHRLHPGHHLGAVERDVEEELQPGDGGVERDGRGAGVDEMKLEVPKVFSGGGVG
jgi:hypothetical protein